VVPGKGCVFFFLREISSAWKKKETFLNQRRKKAQSVRKRGKWPHLPRCPEKGKGRPSPLSIDTGTSSPHFERCGGGKRVGNLYIW